MTSNNYRFLNGGRLIHIRDAVIGDILVSESQQAILDDPAMQRLRQIKQLGFAYLVYPGANHTRFEHSLGAMSITREILQNALNERIEELECAALLHDIGHAAYSHISDALLRRYLHTTHEKLGLKKIANGTVRDKIKDSGLSYSKVVSYMKGKGKGEIITGSLGADRFDYLARDAHYTGVGYGIVDYGHMRNKITISNNRPAIYDSAVSNAEYMLIARYLMFSSIYHHHTILIAQGMYEKAVDFAVESGKMLPEDLETLNDWQMLSSLYSTKESQRLVKRLSERTLFKRAFFDKIGKNVDENEVRAAIEKEGFGSDEYICNIHQYKGHNDDAVVVFKDGSREVKLTELSPIVGALVKMIKESRRLLVACDQGKVPKMKKIVERFVR